MGWTATAPEAVKSAMHLALSAVGLYLQGDARLRAPVDTGRLRGSITYATQRERSQTDAGAKAGDAVSRPDDTNTLHVGTNVEYAAYVEYGTRRMAEQPYLIPALDENRQEVREIFAEYLRRGLRSGK